MVLKRSNCSVNSGNTLRVRYHRQRYAGSRDHLLSKFYMNGIIQPADFEEQNANILLTSDEYVQDGGLAIQQNFHYPLVYSLNKRKRWLLRETVTNTIRDMAEETCEEDFKITLVEYVHYGNPIFLSRSIAMCCEYWDSHNVQPHVTARKDASYITDLRKLGKSEEEEGKVTRRRKYHNQHKRGIQRKEKLLAEREQHQQPFIPRNHGNLAELHGCPEIRYELWSPAEYTSRKAFYKLDSYSRIWDKASTYGMRPNKALKKSKGLRSKRDRAESWFGFSTQGLQEQVEQEQEHPGGLGEEWMWQLEGGEEVQERERAIELDLQILMKHCSWKTKWSRKACKKESVTDQETYVFVTDDKRKKVKVEVKQISRASSSWTKKYGKGCAVVLETDPYPAADDDDDFEMVDENTDCENLSGLAGEMLELLKNHLQVFNDDFCVCKVPIVDIVPRKLAEVYGPGVEVSLIHPYAFVINLGRSQGHWCMVCQMSPGLGFWPDPESQTNVALRVTLQGRVPEPDVHAVNSSLRNILKGGSRSGHTLAELLALANEVIEEMLGQALSVKSTKSQAVLCGNRTIHKHLFSTLTEVKTAEEVYLEDKHDEQILPSVARIDLLNLIDLDFDLVEECAICFASWEGEKWSWVSHNVSLLPCRHSFCRQCWQLYLCQNIKEGKTTLYCMEYGCQTEVDPATVTSLVPPKFLTRWQHQCAESHVTKAGDWHWCPKAGCQYLAKIVKPQDKKSQRLCRYGVPVQCHCGELWCLLCQKSSHWPALCSHGDMYYKMLLENGSEMGRPVASNMTFFVKLKKCPRCKYPMEKNGGCSHMTCRCSHHFCWECLGDWDSHVSTGLVCPVGKKDVSTVELDSAAVMTFHASQYQNSESHRHAWKKMTTTFMRSRVNLLVSTQRKNMWRRSPNAMNTSQLDATQAFFTDMLVFVRDLHQVLENCSVLLSNTPRSCQPQNLITCTSQLAFTTSRLEATLNSPALKHMRGELLTRLKSLYYLAWSAVDRLAMLAPFVQAMVDSHSRQSARQGSRNGDTKLTS
ncbi:uncharacterized protein LOC124133049 [Haliotis rufescens]|uniref:uncharacterized protein LOC124133049 n=1 Tax=Haliotis rufescens TaxID=6454 RepID=UPI00201F936A|nr:uncharacterized protein LOC124133049 [Haliotis rufescens]XP_048257728.1 uncharacterized protein LOC124133049 [Haliotis rufescens]